MPLDLRLAKSLSCQGKTFNFSRAAEADGPVGKEPSLAAAKTGTLSTRTSDTAGTLTMTAGHGFTDGQTIDIYWSGGVAYGCLIGTVATNSVPFTSAAGDVLPAATTAITAMVVHNETFPVTYTALQALGVYAGGVPCVARFVDGSDADVAVVVVYPGNEAYVWFTGDDAGAANPFVANVASVYLTHGSSAGTVAPSAYAYVN